MKTIGLVGGTTWHSTLDYYRYFNDMVAAERGEFESAKVLINSLNFGEIRQLQSVDDWKKISVIICKAARDLERGGADCILLGSSSMHRVAEDVEASVNVPVIHIVKETAQEIKNAGIDTVALLGTRLTMQLSFFKDTLSDYGIQTLMPEADGVEKINTSIFEEPGKGSVPEPSAKKLLIEIIDRLAGLGADGIVLGCTEIPMLIKAQDCPLPLFDTTMIHARAGVDFALGKRSL